MRQFEVTRRKLLNNKDKNLGSFHTEKARQAMYIHGSFFL